jgi:hypothetical protein
MTKLSPTALSQVTGGTTSTNDQITQQLTALQSSIKDIASPNNNNNSSQTMMMMVMMMAMRPQTNVVAAGGPPPAYAAAPGPVVNIATRVRH